MNLTSKVVNLTSKVVEPTSNHTTAKASATTASSANQSTKKTQIKPDELRLYRSFLDKIETIAFSQNGNDAEARESYDSFKSTLNRLEGMENPELSESEVTTLGERIATLLDRAVPLNPQDNPLFSDPSLTPAERARRMAMEKLQDEQYKARFASLMKSYANPELYEDQFKEDDERYMREKQARIAARTKKNKRTDRETSLCAHFNDRFLWFVSCIVSLRQNYAPRETNREAKANASNASENTSANSSETTPKEPIANANTSNANSNANTKPKPKFFAELIRFHASLERALEEDRGTDAYIKPVGEWIRVNLPKLTKGEFAEVLSTASTETLVRIKAKLLLKTMRAETIEKIWKADQMRSLIQLSQIYTQLNKAGMSDLMEMLNELFAECGFTSGKRVDTYVLRDAIRNRIRKVELDRFQHLLPTGDPFESLFQIANNMIAMQQPLPSVSKGKKKASSASSESKASATTATEASESLSESKSDAKTEAQSTSSVRFEERSEVLFDDFGY